MTVLNGAEGLGELVAGLATQVTSILDIVRRGNGVGSVDGKIPASPQPISAAPPAGTAPNN